MPDLVTADGETVAESLTKDELEALAGKGVEFDVDSDDHDGTDDGSGEAVPDSDAEDSIEDIGSPGVGEGGDGESDESPSERGAESADGESSGSGGDDTGDSESDGLDALDSDGGDSGGESGGEPESGAELDVDEVEIDDMGEAGESAGGESPDEITGEIDEYEHSVDSEAAEMDSRGEDELAEKFDVDVDEIHRTDDRDIERWHRLLKNLREYGTDIEQRKRERDERIGETSVRAGHEELEQRARSSGAITELKKGFRKLVSRPTPKPATVGPQIDPYNVTRRAAGDMTIQELFEERVTVETGERCVGLATDISGSMGSDIQELKIAGGVIAEATEIIGDDFTWSAFTDQYSHGHTPSEERLDLRIVTGPSEDFDWKHVDSFKSRANEPTAAGIRDCRMLMEQSAALQNVMIVITDGMALVEEDGTYAASKSSPVDQARRAVRECREDGFEVIGLGIGDMSDEKMDETFGSDQRGNPNYKLTNIDDLAQDILEIYESQLSVSRGR